MGLSFYSISISSAVDMEDYWAKAWKSRVSGFRRSSYPLYWLPSGLLLPPGLIPGMEGLKVSDANLVVCVHPSKIRRLSQAVLHDLSSLLFKFNETFNGVVLAYDVGFVGEVAKILPAIHPYFGVKLNAKLLLFFPKPNMLLEGKVVKLTQESLHVIVLGFASAIITCEDIRKEFTYKTIKGKESILQ
ncbi:hypothetical protein SAY86_010409 [Trapa natans]|uniref:DNA-directed RNA polymerase subunit n=1 Tax=Trapa natans TaxID=22666 RepID=A0AAN7LVW1_TRANT|nr:hypothetical protein SAY86_010409 [Trapa natans]